ncbi:mesogenin-1 [Tamandua tetradactyla]|uniref:mesogenin-1 n=1 Tax=Tamandua tetradactyla TaxID=48850 RepID=UPI0040547931
MDDPRRPFLGLQGSLGAAGSPALLGPWAWGERAAPMELGVVSPPPSLSPAPSPGSPPASPGVALAAGPGGTACPVLASQPPRLPGVPRAQTGAKVRMSVQRRRKASEREKLRMRALAEALHALRSYLPPAYSPREQPLTKIQTLRRAIQYIRELAELLGRAQRA